MRSEVGQFQVADPAPRWVRFKLSLTRPDDAAASDIATTLQDIEASAFRLTLMGVGHIRQHTLWVGVEPNPALMSLRDKIEQALQQTGLPADLRPYQPHVKLGRLRRRTDLRSFLRVHADFRLQPFDVRQFSLIESQRTNSRTNYAHRADYPLV